MGPESADPYNQLVSNKVIDVNEGSKNYLIEKTLTNSLIVNQKKLLEKIEEEDNMTEKQKTPNSNLKNSLLDNEMGENERESSVCYKIPKAQRDELIGATSYDSSQGSPNALFIWNGFKLPVTSTPTDNSMNNDLSNHIVSSSNKKMSSSKSNRRGSFGDPPTNLVVNMPVKEHVVSPGSFWINVGLECADETDLPTSTASFLSNSELRKGPNKINCSSSTASTTGPMCRICHDGEDREELISPCNCSGSLALVHKSCLEKWLMTTPDVNSCEICGFQFTLIRRPRSFANYLLDSNSSNSYARRSLCNDIVCFFVLTPLILASISLCVLAVIRFATSTDNKDLNHGYNQGYIQGTSALGTVSFGNVVVGRPEDMERYLADQKDDKDFDSYDEQQATWEDFGASEYFFASLVALLTIVYFGWLLYTFRYQRYQFIKWRNTNHRVILVTAEEKV